MWCGGGGGEGSIKGEGRGGREKVWERRNNELILNNNKDAARVTTANVIACIGGGDRVVMIEFPLFGHPLITQSEHTRADWVGQSPGCGFMEGNFFFFFA
jgi:hypothetical protein